jgi:hypothetical protein
MRIVDEMIRKWLNRLLGSVCEEITAESINVAMLSGVATLTNLTIKRTFAEALGLPFVVNGGSIGALHMDIPLRSLRSRPIQLRICDVLLSLSPNPRTCIKKAQLEKHLFEWDQLEQEPKPIDPHSRAGALLGKIADNICITLEDVHVRFEDALSRQPSWRSVSDASRCFSLGLTLDSFTLEGCIIGPTGRWEVGQAKGALRFVNKLATVGTDGGGSCPSRAANPGSPIAPRASDGASPVGACTAAPDDRHLHPSGLGVYLHHGERALRQEPDSEAWRAEMRRYIARASQPTGNSWMVGPFTTVCRLSLDKNLQRFTRCRSRIWDVDAPLEHGQDEAGDAGDVKRTSAAAAAATAAAASASSATLYSRPSPRSSSDSGSPMAGVFTAIKMRDPRCVGRPVVF